MDKKANHIINVFCLLSAIFLLSQNTFSQLVTINAQLDTNRMMIGDQVNMLIEVTKPENSLIIFPEFENNLTDEIEITSKSGIDSILTEADKILLSQKITLTSFDSGLLYIPPLDFIFTSGGYTDTISSTAGYLEVIPVKIDTTGTIRDIKGLYRAPYSLGELLPFILLILLANALTWFITYYLRKRKKDEPILNRAKPAEPAYIIALRELDKLKTEKLWQQNKVKQYYTRLTEIIRTYIERRFYIRAMEQTTNEILEEFQGRNIKNINYNMLVQLLNLADMVKFAKGEPLPDENMTHMDNAYTFIKNTKHQSSQEDNENDPENSYNRKELSA